MRVVALAAQPARVPALPVVAVPRVVLGARPRLPREARHMREPGRPAARAAADDALSPRAVATDEAHGVRRYLGRARLDRRVRRRLGRLRGNRSLQSRRSFDSFGPAPFGEPVPLDGRRDIFVRSVALGISTSRPAASPRPRPDVRPRLEGIPRGRRPRPRGTAARRRPSAASCRPSCARPRRRSGMPPSSRASCSGRSSSPPARRSDRKSGAAPCSLRHGRVPTAERRAARAFAPRAVAGTMI